MIKDTCCNDEIILIMAFRAHTYDCASNFYDDKEMEIRAVASLCKFALDHDLLHTDISNELLSYIELKGYRKEVKEYENQRV